MGIEVSPFTRKVHAGVSIHANAVRGATVLSDGNIRSFAEVLFPQPILESDVTDPKALIQALTQLKLQAQFTSSYVAVGFPEKYAFSRQYLLPKLDRQEIGEAIDWQIDKIFPFPKKDIYLDWKLLKLEADHTLVLVTAVPKVLLDHLRLCLEKAGLFPISFEPSASAISRVLSPTQAKEAIILELESHNACATLVFQGTSLTTSTFNITPTTQLPELFTTIGQSILAMSQKYLLKGSNQPVQVYLTGEKASTQVISLLTQTLNFPTELFNVPHVTPAYHLAYIAAKSYVLPPSSDKSINLLPTELQSLYAAQLKKEKAQTGLTRSLFLGGPAILISIFAFVLSLVYLGTINRSIAAQKTVSDAPLVAGLNLAQVNQDSVRYVNLFPLKVSPETTLSLIQKSQPPSISLTSLVFNAGTGTYTLSGLAKTRADLIEYKTILESLTGVKKVSLPLSALETTENVTFSLTFNLDKKS